MKRKIFYFTLALIPLFTLWSVSHPAYTNQEQLQPTPAPSPSPDPMVIFDNMSKRIVPSSAYRNVKTGPIEAELLDEASSEKVIRENGWVTLPKDAIIVYRLWNFGKGEIDSITLKVKSPTQESLQGAITLYMDEPRNKNGSRLGTTSFNLEAANVPTEVVISEVTQPINTDYKGLGLRTLILYYSGTGEIVLDKIAFKYKN